LGVAYVEKAGGKVSYRLLEYVKCWMVLDSEMSGNDLSKPQSQLAAFGNYRQNISSINLKF